MEGLGGMSLPPSQRHSHRARHEYCRACLCANEPLTKELTMELNALMVRYIVNDVDAAIEFCSR